MTLKILRSQVCTPYGLWFAPVTCICCHLPGAHLTVDASTIRLLILKHVLENQEARDTIDGITWWILRECVELGTAQVREAVDELVGKNILISHKRPEDYQDPKGPNTSQVRAYEEQIFYSLNRRKLGEILRILEGRVV